MVIITEQLMCLQVWYLILLYFWPRTILRITGSFDKTCKLWNVESGKCYYTYKGHSAEVVCVQFDPLSRMIASGSMDATVKLWDVQDGYEITTLSGHSAEVIALQFNSAGEKLVSGSFDHTVSFWDIGTHKREHYFIGWKQSYIIVKCFKHFLAI